MLRFKNILPVCLFSLRLSFCNMDSLIIKPELSFESFSSGSIHNTTNNSNTKIAALGLEISKTTKEWSVFGSFKFTTASNFDLISTYELLSPLLALCFGVPGSKKFKQEVNDLIRSRDIQKLEYAYLNLIAA